jgi:hypothetical protein
MDYPTPETVAAWDDASLFATVGYHAATRASTYGFDSLNETERVLCCLSELVGEVFNGGFGQWLFNADPQVIGHTAWACQTVDAQSTARLVNEVLGPLQNPLTADDWWGYLHSLPDEEHQRFETYTGPFTEVEQDLHRCAYRYARERWADLRTA